MALSGFAASLRAADEAKAPYPLTTCIVSGEKLGEMGPPPSLNYKGTELQFCCKSCIKTFESDPAKYFKKYEQAVKAAK